MNGYLVFKRPRRDWAGAGNLISGNGRAGVAIEGSNSLNNKLLQNLIGTNAAGNAALANGREGVLVVDASLTSVGSNLLNTRNVISGNAGNGVTISGEGAFNWVAANYIGVNSAGTAALPNEYGVSITAAYTAVGGTSDASHVVRNIISGNRLSGVYVNANNAVIKGNYIGTIVAGTGAVGNNDGGVYVNGGSNAQIGGVNTFGESLGEGNLISGNGTQDLANPANGITVVGASSVLIRGNFIGTDLAGAIALPNKNDGISIEANAPDPRIGGPANEDRNLISGNLARGIHDGGTRTNVQKNIIGKNKSMNGALPNGGDGIRGPLRAASYLRT